MKVYRMLIKFIKNPTRMILKLADEGWLRWMSDEMFLRIIYNIRMGEPLHLDHPRTYTEKIQWLKIHDRRETYIPLVDKYAAKSVVRDILGENYIVPLIGVYQRVEDIPWDQLPNQFVLKCTHGSQSNIICKHKASLDIVQSKKELNRCMKKNYGWHGRNWAISQVQPQIICEPYMADPSSGQLHEYKIYCFHGEPRLVEVEFENPESKRNFYDTYWNFQDTWIYYLNDPGYTINRPPQLEHLLQIASKLSAGVPHVRIDLYEINGQVYFGEFTLYRGSGFDKLHPESFDKQMSEWLQLPTDSKLA